MPIYEYVSDAGGCDRCGGRFTIMERMSDPETCACPDCGQPCHRIISAPAVASSGSHLLRESHLANHGFTQYRRAGKGRYERIVGKGPSRIESD
jgi:putative FmdB family regulatory protein